MPGATLRTAGGESSAKDQTKLALKADVSKYVVKVASAPANKATGKLKSSTGPFAALYALKIDDVCVSVILLKLRLKEAFPGNEANNRRVVTPD